MPLYHTMGVRSLLSMALVSGGFVCQPRFETSGALDLIERHRVTNLYLVPTLYHDLVADPAFEAADVSSVRKLGFAGAPMTDGLLRRLAGAFRPELFVNHYGSSEIYTFTVCPDAPAKPGSAGEGRHQPAHPGGADWNRGPERRHAAERGRARSSPLSNPTRRSRATGRRPRRRREGAPRRLVLHRRHRPASTTTATSSSPDGSTT